MNRRILKYSRRSLEVSKRLREDLSPCPPILFAELGGKTLGLYDSHDDVILISSGLTSMPYGTLRQIALHEKAHRLNWMVNGSLEHDAGFRELCRQLGVDEGYEKARVAISRHSGLVERIRKLKALGESPFEAESQSALAKVRSLMASYAIEDEEGDDDSICMGDLWGPVGRMPYSVQVLSRIVQLHTGVFVVKEHLDGGTRLRAYGRRDEVEVALYLMEVLHNALEKELARRRALTPDLYYGVGGTNSFYAGVLAAMKERMEKHDGDRSEEKALTLAQADNEERARRIVFQDCRITRRSGKGRLNRAAYAGGQDYGSSLTIAKGIGKDSHGPLMLS